jgi:hypothetical protein
VISGDNKWYTVCNVILGAAVAGLDLPVNRALITTGQIAWDDCCEGQLAVSYTRTSPTETFPTEQTTLNAFSEGIECTPPYEIGEITVQITRCAPQALNGQQAPSPEALSKAALQTLVDANQIRRSVSAALCALHADVTNRFDYFVRAQLMLGPEGGCAGSELYLYTGLAVG